MNVLQLLEALLPAGEEIASLFIHNPNSQHKFMAIVGPVNAFAPVLEGIASAKVTTAPEGFVAAGTPSAHAA